MRFDCSFWIFQNPTNGVEEENPNNALMSTDNGLQGDGFENMDTSHDYAHASHPRIPTTVRNDVFGEVARLQRENDELSDQVARLILGVDNLRKAAKYFPKVEGSLDLPTALTLLGIESLVPTRIVNEDERKLVQEMNKLKVELERTSREKKQLGDSCQKLAVEMMKLEESKRKFSLEKREAVASATNHGNKTLRKANAALQLEKKHLRSQLESAICKGESYKNETEIAKAQTQEADETKRRLLEMFDLAVLKRADAAAVCQRSLRSGKHYESGKPPPPFPNGDMLVSAVMQSQVHLHDFYFFLVSLCYAKHDGRRSEVEISELIFDKVVVEAALVAQKECDTFVAGKKRSMQSFTDNECFVESPLAKLFWFSTMQTVVKNTVTSNKFSSLYAVERLCDNELHDSNEWLQWAARKNIQHHEDMEGRHVNEFLQGMITLLLQCQFSDPPCYLWPPVGETVSYSSSLHSQQIAKPCFAKRARSGDKVRVLYPGLYFADPSPKAGKVINPIVKPTVLLFEGSKGHGGSSYQKMPSVFSGKKTVRDLARGDARESSGEDGEEVDV